MMSQIALKTRIAFMAAGLFVVMAWLLLAFALDLLQQDLEGQARAEQISDATRIGQHVDDVLRARMSALEAVAQAIQKIDYLKPEQLQGFLDNQRGVSSLFRHGLLFASAQGTVIADSPRLAGRRGMSLSHRTYFTAILGGGSVISEPVLGQATGEPVVILAAPVKDGAGAVTGIVAGSIYLAGADLIGAAESPSQTGSEFLVVSPATGLVVSATDPSWVQQTIPQEIHSLLTTKANQADPATPASQIISRGDRRLLATARSLVSAPWILIATTPMESVQAPMLSLRRRLLEVALIATLAMLFATWFLSRYLLTPLDQLCDSLSTQGYNLSLLPPSSVPELRKLTGRINHLIQVICDQTQQLREDGERFRILADSSPTLIRMVDADGMSTWINHTWRTYTGTAQTKGEAWADVVHPDERTAVVRQLALHREARIPLSMEYRLRSHDGHYRWFADRSVPVYASDGSYRGQVSSCIDVTERKQDGEHLKRLLRENRQLVGSVFRVAEEERQRIARDLHDDIGQWITAIRANNVIVRNILGTTAEESARQAATSIDHCAASLHDAVRKMLNDLRPDHMETLGLQDGIRELVEQWQRAFPGVQCHLIVDKRIGDIPAELRTTAYRVVQESLTNVAKHSRASQVDVQLTLGPGALGIDDQLAISIEDDGIGGARDNLETGGLGLVGMRERVMAVRGEFSIRSRRNSGTRVTVLLPLPVPTQDLPGDQDVR